MSEKKLKELMKKKLCRFLLSHRPKIHGRNWVANLLLGGGWWLVKNWKIAFVSAQRATKSRRMRCLEFNYWVRLSQKHFKSIFRLLSRAAAQLSVECSLPHISYHRTYTTKKEDEKVDIIFPHILHETHCAIWVCHAPARFSSAHEPSERARINHGKNEHERVNGVRIFNLMWNQNLACSLFGERRGRNNSRVHEKTMRMWNVNEEKKRISQQQVSLPTKQKKHLQLSSCLAAQLFFFCVQMNPDDDNDDWGKIIWNLESFLHIHDDDASGEGSLWAI